MSRIAGLQKLSVAYLRVYRFHSTSAEQSDYLVKLEKDPRTLENSFVVYYAVLRAHRLFLFSNDSSQQCKDVVNLEQCTVRDTPLDKQWPACCNSGCQIWLPGCSASGLGAGAQVPAELACCWQLGFFSGSKWKRALEAYAKLKGPAEPVDITDSEYDNDEYDAGDPELSGLWATLAELEPSQVGSSSLSVETSSASIGRQSPPPLPPGPKPAVGRSFGTGGGSRGQPSPPVRRTPEQQTVAQPPQPSQQTLMDAPVPPIKPVHQKCGWPPGSHRQPQAGGARTPQQLPPKPQHQQQPSAQPPLPPPPPAKQATNLPQPPKPQPTDASSTQPPTLPMKPGPKPNSNQGPSQPPQPQPQLQPISQKPPPPPIRNNRVTDDHPTQPSIQQPPQQTPQQTVATDLYDLMSRSLCVDALCSYFCRGYYSAKDMSRARQLMKQATDSGVYMLRGFCNSQAGQDKTLCVKYSMVYKFRIRVLQEGYQIWNEHNSTVHSSMEALLFHHHLFPIRVAQQIQHELLLRRPYDLEQATDNCLMMPLSSALWNHGSKEMCAEILRNSEDGTYTLRFDPDSGGAVLCVTHRCQILKFRVVASMTADNRREFGFHHLPTVPKFGSLEEFIVHHHKNPIRGSSADGDIILKMPFQLVPRCQQELDFQQISLDAAIFTTGSVAAVSNKVARMRSGNFLVLRRSQQPLLQQPGESESTDSSAAAGAGVEHSLVVRDDHGSVKTFRIVERDTDLSFRPQKTFTLAERPELVTDRIEKMVHFLCISSKFLSPEITLLVKP